MSLRSGTKGPSSKYSRTICRKQSSTPQFSEDTLDGLWITDKSREGLMSFSSPLCRSLHDSQSVCLSGQVQYSLFAPFSSTQDLSVSSPWRLRRASSPSDSLRGVPSKTPFVQMLALWSSRSSSSRSST